MYQLFHNWPFYRIQLETIFIQTPDNEVYNKLRSLLDSLDKTELIKGVRCTKKAFNMFESRGKDVSV